MNIFDFLDGPWPRLLRKSVAWLIMTGLAIQAPWMMEQLESYAARATQQIGQIVENIEVDTEQRPMRSRRGRERKDEAESR